MGEQLYNHIYENKTLHIHFDTEPFDTYRQSLYNQYLKITKHWNDELNTAWIARHYQASKMILSATLMLNSAQYAEESNLKVVEPYLYYYAILSCARALILTNPNLTWSDGSILNFTHKKTINITVDTIKLLDKEIANDIEKKILRARDYRELFSYRFPLNGLRSLPPEVSISLDETIDICVILVELAQFNSEVMEQAYEKNCADKTFGYVEDVLEKCIRYETDDNSFIDNDDFMRIGSIVQRQKKLYSILLTMNAGMVEDFFGSWVDDEDTSGKMFNPDLYNGILFDFP